MKEGDIIGLKLNKFPLAIFVYLIYIRCKSICHIEFL